MNQRISFVAVVLVLGVAVAAVVSRPDDTQRFPAPPEMFDQGTSAEGTSAEAAVPASIMGSGGVALALENVTIPDQDAVAVVNGKPIFTTEYEEELTAALESVTMQYGLDWNDPQNLAYLPSFQQQILEQVIDKALITQLADEKGVLVDPGDVEAEVAAVQMQVQADPSIPDWESFLAAYNLTEESIREYITYELLVQGLTENLGPAPDVVHVNASHILVETEELGQEILDRLDAGEDFAALAAEFSIDPGSKDNGGELGWFPPGVMVPEFESAAFALNPGEISGLVQTDFGYHIILVHDKEARPLDASVAGQMDQQRFQAWFEAQKASAAIEQLYTFDEQAPAP